MDHLSSDAGAPPLQADEEQYQPGVSAGVVPAAVGASDAGWSSFLPSYSLFSPIVSHHRSFASAFADPPAPADYHNYDHDHGGLGRTSAADDRGNLIIGAGGNDADSRFMVQGGLTLLGPAGDQSAEPRRPRGIDTLEDGERYRSPSHAHPDLFRLDAEDDVILDNSSFSQRLERLAAPPQPRAPDLGGDSVQVFPGFGGGSQLRTRIVDSPSSDEHVFDIYDQVVGRDYDGWPPSRTPSGPAGSTAGGPGIVDRPRSAILHSELEDPMRALRRATGSGYGGLGSPSSATSGVGLSPVGSPHPRRPILQNPFPVFSHGSQNQHSSFQQQQQYSHQHPHHQQQHYIPVNQHLHHNLSYPPAPPQHQQHQYHQQQQQQQQQQQTPLQTRFSTPPRRRFHSHSFDANQTGGFGGVSSQFHHPPLPSIAAGAGTSGHHSHGHGSASTPRSTASSTLSSKTSDSSSPVGADGRLPALGSGSVGSGGIGSPLGATSSPTDPRQFWWVGLRTPEERQEILQVKQERVHGLHRRISELEELRSTGHSVGAHDDEVSDDGDSSDSVSVDEELRETLKPLPEPLDPQGQGATAGGLSHAAVPARSNLAQVSAPGSSQADRRAEISDWRSVAASAPLSREEQERRLPPHLRGRAMDVPPSPAFPHHGLIKNLLDDDNDKRLSLSPPPASRKRLQLDDTAAAGVAASSLDAAAPEFRSAIGGDLPLSSEFSLLPPILVKAPSSSSDEDAGVHLPVLRTPTSNAQPKAATAVHLEKHTDRSSAPAPVPVMTASDSAAATAMAAAAETPSCSGTEAADSDHGSDEESPATPCSVKQLSSNESALATDPELAEADSAGHVLATPTTANQSKKRNKKRRKKYAEASAAAAAAVSPAPESSELVTGKQPRRTKDGSSQQGGQAFAAGAAAAAGSITGEDAVCATLKQATTIDSQERIRLRTLFVVFWVVFFLVRLACSWLSPASPGAASSLPVPISYRG